jgi:hypothetical protein
MTGEARVHITAKIPSELHDLMLQRISENKYKDKTDCVTVSLENELRNTQQETNRNTEKSHSRDTEIEELKHVLQEKVGIFNFFSNLDSVFMNIVEFKPKSLVLLSMFPQQIQLVLSVVEKFTLFLKGGSECKCN